jgi:hypothetical protein
MKAKPGAAAAPIAGRKRIEAYGFTPGGENQVLFPRPIRGLALGQDHRAVGRSGVREFPQGAIGRGDHLVQDDPMPDGARLELLPDHVDVERLVHRRRR